MVLSRFRQTGGAPDRRAAPRERVARRSKLMFGGHAEDCRITDISGSGARISSLRALPSKGAVVIVVDLATGFAHEGQVAWAKDGEAGIAFSQSRDLRGLIPASLQAAKALWTLETR